MGYPLQVDGLFCFAVNGEGGCGALANNPGYCPLGINHNKLLLFFNDASLSVGEVVAHKLCAAHPKWGKAVALLCVAQREGVAQLVAVEQCDVALTWYIAVEMGCGDVQLAQCSGDGALGG